MTIVTLWNNAQTGEVRLAQLSDYEEDGTPEEQISVMSDLEAYAGFTCVSTDFTGSVPDADPSLWRWDGQGITATTPPAPEPTTQQVRAVLQEIGMTEAQLDNLFRIAATL